MEFRVESRFFRRSEVNNLSTGRGLIPEWEEQASVFVAWPTADGDFAPWLQEVEATYLAIARAVADRQDVLVAVASDAHQAHVRATLLKGGVARDRVHCIVMPYDDIWVRDTAPLSVVHQGRLAYLDFRFNAWGGKYDCAEDQQIARRLHASGFLEEGPLVAVDFVLEGGSVETDGAGTLMTTTRCLLNPNRNPKASKAEIEAVLRDHLGGEHVLWLDEGHAEGDDTDAHIDTLARFCAQDVMAYTACDDEEDPLYASFSRMAHALEDFTNHRGERYQLVPLPMPSPILSEEGGRLPATYANFLIINGAVLVPVYGDPADDIAMARLGRVFKDRTLIPINCLPLIRQYGSLHCMSMQFPKYGVGKGG